MNHWTRYHTARRTARLANMVIAGLAIGLGTATMLHPYLFPNSLPVMLIGFTAGAAVAYVGAVHAVKAWRE